MISSLLIYTHGGHLKFNSLIILFMCYLASCATVTDEKITVLKTNTPQISPALQNSTDHFLKRKVAIARFSNETKHGASFLRNESEDTVGKQATDILSARLVSTGKFLMVERTDLGKITKEQETFKVDSNLVGADQLIIGSVSEFGRKDTSEVGIFSRTMKQKVYAKVNVRLVDVKTGQILFSQEGEGEALSEVGKTFGVGEEAGYDSTLDDKALSAAISKLVSNLIENLLDHPWTGYILSKEDDSYIIGGGASQGIKKGNKFGVFTLGRSIKNPQTGILIKMPGKKIAELEVQKTSGKDSNEISFCSLVSGNLKSNLSEYEIMENEK
jgi:curli biogenesis system outer membrane secretion channel CsgG